MWLIKNFSIIDNSIKQNEIEKIIRCIRVKLNDFLTSLYVQEKN